MNNATIKTFALMGQPNTGKSTVFNALTGARQHIGNWPGKTVERKEGYFEVGGRKYRILDLPGTYSLFANSEEEMVTRDALAGEGIDVILAILDASQLERSMFLLSDFAGINQPVVVLLNMLDIAEEQGKNIDAERLSRALGVPVLPVIANRGEGLGTLRALLESGNLEGGLLNTSALEEKYRINPVLSELISLMPESGIGMYSAIWLAVKLLEGDRDAAGYVKDALGTKTWVQIERILEGQKEGILIFSDCKFQWIHELAEQSVSAAGGARAVRGRFDRLATSGRWGKFIALGIILGGLLLSIIVGFSLMGIIGAIRGAVTSSLRTWFEAVNAHGALTSLICDAILGGVFIALDMVCYVFAISLVFGYIEEVGYMARISYVFDGVMQRLRLHGKAIMPFLLCLGCTIGGVAGSRVIDSWKQRLLTIAISWVVPCIPVWAVVGVMGSIFFGFGVVWVVISLFAAAALHMFVTSLVFGRSFSSPEDRTGLIMELPPYHRPNKKTLLSFVWYRMKDVLLRATKLITLVSVVFWLLSYSSDGDIASTILYRAGTFIEPVTLFFGLNWELFTAFVVSTLGKEASLGVISALFSTAGGTVNLFELGMGNDSAIQLTAALMTRVSQPQALAFIFGVFFTVPCIAALGATAAETHSVRWTVRMALYYVCVAFVMMGIAYRVGLMIL